MGYMSEELVREGGQFVIDALRNANGEWVKFLDVAYDKQAEEFRMDNPTMDIALWQLEDAGLCSMQELDELMPDGLNNFQFKVTDKGAEFLASGKQFNFHSADL